MTREKAIGNLIHAIRWNDMPKKEALEMAIKALEQEPCDDAISRQAMLEFIHAMYDTHITETEDGEYIDYNATVYGIKKLPSVNPQPKTGHWIRGKYTEDDIRYNDSSYKCSECGRIVDFKENFCPSCGAKMVDPQEGERV